MLEAGADIQVVDRLPRTRGESQSIGDICTLASFRVPEDDLRFVSQTDIVTIQLRPQRLWTAINSDRARLMQMRAGNLAYHLAGSEVRSHWTDECQFVAATAPPRLRERLMDEIGLEPARLEDLPGSVTPNSLRLGNQARGLFERGLVEGRLITKSLVTLMVAEAISEIDTPAAGATSGKIPPTNIARVVDFIEANLDTDLSLAALADVAAMSVYHFARRFRETVGESPHAYVMARRVERAKDLLRYGDSNLAGVAHACGFSSPSHFTTVFREHTGATPGRFRKDVLG